MAPAFERNDNMAVELGEQRFNVWRKTLRNKDLQYDIIDMVMKHYKSRGVFQLCAPRCGGYNFHYRARFVDDSSALMRIPIPAHFRVSEEKLLGEVAALRYIRDNTTIPTPFVLHHGPRDECPGELGPFMILEYIENARELDDVINTPSLTKDDSPVLDPNIDEEKLEAAYSGMADTLLQLSKCNLPVIGALGFRDDEGDETEVRRRPLPMNMVELGEIARVPHFELPGVEKTFKTSTEYYVALADMHLQHLSYQRNDLVESANDCRKKYISRQLFRKLASEGRLCNSEFDKGPFKLWCDDLRPANVLVDEDDNMAAVIDWEFTYAAPADFTFSPPWWLLLKEPDQWEEGLDDWSAQYEKRLPTFLRALEAREKAFVEEGRLDGSEAMLSSRMRESWETGGFWVTYAARKSWAFDGIYWSFLDERFFGRNESGDFMERLKLLTPGQVAAMEPFVERKMREKEEGTLVDWYEPGAELPPDVLQA